MQHTISVIGTIRSPYTQKFGIARQPGLVPAAKVRIVLNREFAADSVRGLQDFEYIWVHFIFHDAVNEGWSQMVRPPRLGGKQKMGVFATRSPHRPNHLGLSLLKLENISQATDGITLECSGGDLLDGTPVIDIKPYIPFVEAKPDAACGFVTGAPEQLKVVWQKNSRPAGLSDETAALIEQSIAQDPRPAYQDIPERIYVMEIAEYEVRFRISGRTAEIIALTTY